MKHKMITSAAIAVFTVSLLVTSAPAANTTPGSSADPLVSQSYVDSKVNYLQQQLNTLTNSNTIIPPSGTTTQPTNSTISDTDKNKMIDEVVAYLKYNYPDQFTGNSNNTTSNITSNTTSNDKYVTIQVRKGQTLVGNEGTEIILRSGAAVGYSKGKDGVSDITTGADILNNMPVKYNHLVIVPRTDNRGIKVLDDSWIMVKGAFTIVN